MNILVVGTGAVGGYLGTCLQLTGRDVTFFARPQSVELLQENGIRVIDYRGHERAVSPRLVTRESVDRHWDIIVLAVKGQALPSVIDDISPAVGPDTVIVPTLNGVHHMQTLTEHFGRQRLLGGFCFLSTEQREDRSIKQLTEGASLTIGELDRRTDRISDIAAVFNDADFTFSVSSTIEWDMWEKWYFLATAGAINCLLDGDIGSVMSVPGGAATAARLIDESRRVCHAAGFDPREPARTQAEKLLTTPGSRFTTSMYRDLRAGRAVEHRSILGDLVDEAKSYDVDTPLLEAAYARLGIHSSGG